MKPEDEQYVVDEYEAEYEIEEDDFDKKDKEDSEIEEGDIEENNPEREINSLIDALKTKNTVLNIYHLDVFSDKKGLLDRFLSEFNKNAYLQILNLWNYELKLKEKNRILIDFFNACPMSITTVYFHYDVSHNSNHEVENLAEGYYPLTAALKNIVNLSDLHIDGLDFSNCERLKAFCRDLSDLKSLAKFTLTLVKWSEESIAYFGEWLANSSIIDLTLNHMKISHKEHELFCQSLQKNKQLKAIQFQNTLLTNQSLSSYGKKIFDVPTLESFSLYGEYLLNHHGLDTTFEALKRTKRLTSLSLGTIHIDNTFITKLVAVFPSLPLRTLALSGLQNLSIEGVTALFNWLQTNSTLESLNLNGLHLPTLDICKITITSLAQNKHLRKLFIWQEFPLQFTLTYADPDTCNNNAFFKAICDLLKTNNTITDLTMKVDRLNKSEYTTFKEMLKQNKTLKKLEVTDHGFMQFLYKEEFCQYVKNTNFSLHTLKVGRDAPQELLSFGLRNQKLEIYKIFEAIANCTPLLPPLASIIISYYLETDYDPKYNLDSEDKDKLIQFVYKKHQQQEDTLLLDGAQHKELIEWIETQTQAQTKTQTEPKSGHKNG